MHRSGTSCLTGIMQGLGVELGEVFTENLYNKRGNRENSRIVNLNDAVLNTNKSAWNRPVVVSKWTPEQAHERDSIIQELQGRIAAHWGFKDTRVLFTLPFWLEAIESPLFIGTFRHPHRVALSLRNRDQSPPEDGWELWRIYNERLLELVEQYGIALTDFDQPDELYLSDVLDKLIALGLDPALAARGGEFFDPDLRNQASSSVDGVSLPADVLSVYDELLNHHARS
ncbi:MAG: sulfotransferase family protein [Gammaproteobacteria bacterium]|jgi:hypothetical protein|nr:sulfotransferase family protein [Gammaproteobacteria bacterium]